MTAPAPTACDKNHRFPGEIIRHGVWLSYRFPLSSHDVQELLFGLKLESLSYGASCPGLYRKRLF
jgi:transposase-like protein